MEIKCSHLDSQVAHENTKLEALNNLIQEQIKLGTLKHNFLTEILLCLLLKGSQLAGGYILFITCQGKHVSN